MSAPAEAPALKDWFNEARYRQIARDVARIWPPFDRRQFLRLVVPEFAHRSLLDRVHLAADALAATLPRDYPAALAILRELAPSIRHGFVSVVLPDFVARHGLDHFATSIDALKFFTPFGSSEFAVREFLRRDFDRTFAIMLTWARDPDEHVRRLASEGTRPRLPWSFRLNNLVADPAPVVPLLEALKADSSPYVRRSVANHLNDISKDHPDWLIAWLRRWDLAVPETAWIAKRAVRTLIKRGHAGAFALFQFTARPAVQLRRLQLSPARVRLGSPLEFAFVLTSVARRPQTLVVDFAVHFVKKSGATAPKVFKLKEVILPPLKSMTFGKRLILRPLTTRTHYAGRHRLEILVNGRRMGSGDFHLETATNAVAKSRRI